MPWKRYAKEGIVNAKQDIPLTLFPEQIDRTKDTAEFQIIWRDLNDDTPYITKDDAAQTEKLYSWHMQQARRTGRYTREKYFGGDIEEGTVGEKIHKSMVADKLNISLKESLYSCIL